MHPAKGTGFTFCGVVSCHQVVSHQPQQHDSVNCRSRNSFTKGHRLQKETLLTACSMALESTQAEQGRASVKAGLKCLTGDFQLYPLKLSQRRVSDLPTCTGGPLAKWTFPPVAALKKIKADFSTFSLYNLFKVAAVAVSLCSVSFSRTGKRRAPRSARESRPTPASRGSHNTSCCCSPTTFSSRFVLFAPLPHLSALAAAEGAAPQTATASQRRLSPPVSTGSITTNSPHGQARSCQAENAATSQQKPRAARRRLTA